MSRRNCAGIFVSLALACGLSLPSAQAQQGPSGGSGTGARGAAAETSRAEGRAGGGSGVESAERGELPPLPADRTTEHSVTIAGRTMSFSATAGTIRLSNARDGSPTADVAYIAFVKHGEDSASRPVAFIFNGGPGYASGWLNLGGLGPWRLPMQGDADAPSASPKVVDNQETWLDFADLVFIDPPGTGYGRILGGEDARKALWSVQGDIDALSTVVRRWIEQNNRMASPKLIVGESYGGFRAPKVAHELMVDQGVGVSGVAMISPVFEFAKLEDSTSPMAFVSTLPSMAAVAREISHPIVRSDLADVEDYAEGAFLGDLLKGPNDAAAVSRLSAKVAELTGLDPSLVRSLRGRVPVDEFRRAFWRASGKIGSQYDGSVAGFDPAPFAPRSRAPDQLRIGLHAPITEAMVDMYHAKLDWVVPRGRYQFLNEQASRSWDWGRGAEAVGDLTEDLALDPHFHALVVHGLTDLVTPYFGTKMELDQLPSFGAPGRLEFDVLPGGHMVYIRDESRRRLADAARRLVSAAEGTGGASKN